VRQHDFYGNGLPLIGPVSGAKGIYAAYGYGGNGITFSFLAAQLIGDLIAGSSSELAAISRWTGRADQSAVEGFSSTTVIPMYLRLLSRLPHNLRRRRREFHPDPLVTGGLPAHFLQEFPHRIELRAETFPISGLQSLDCPIVSIERLLRPARHGPAFDGRLLCHA
jgi:hypothetical protein